MKEAYVTWNVLIPRPVSEAAKERYRRLGLTRNEYLALALALAVNTEELYESYLKAVYYD